jgi:hypothetical protein
MACLHFSLTSPPPPLPPGACATPGTGDGSSRGQGLRRKPSAFAGSSGGDGDGSGGGGGGGGSGGRGGSLIRKPSITVAPADMTSSLHRKPSMAVPQPQSQDPGGGGGGGSLHRKPSMVPEPGGYRRKPSMTPADAAGYGGGPEWSGQGSGPTLFTAPAATSTPKGFATAGNTAGMRRKPSMTPADSAGYGGGGGGSGGGGLRRKPSAMAGDHTGPQATAFGMAALAAAEEASGRPALAATWAPVSPRRTPGFATANQVTVKPAGTSGDTVLTRVRVEWGSGARGDTERDTAS